MRDEMMWMRMRITRKMRMRTMYDKHNDDDDDDE